MKPVKIPLDKLTEDPQNARVHPERNLAAIEASLARFGQQKPIVVAKDGTVVAGNGTLAAARRLGWDALLCVQTDLPPDEARAFAIADNRTAELAEWDHGALLAAAEQIGCDLGVALNLPTSTPDDDSPSTPQLCPQARTLLCPSCGHEWDAVSPLADIRARAGARCGSATLSAFDNAREHE